MEIGDLVKFKHSNKGIGIVMEGSKSTTGRLQRTRVYWYTRGWFEMHFPRDLEVIDESR